MDYLTWYNSLEKPWYAPEPWVFGLAWGIIYPLIAVTIIYLLYLYKKKEVDKFPVLVLTANLVANLLFTPVTLGTGDLVLSSFMIIFILGTLAVFIITIYEKSKLLVILSIPYFIWVFFATFLQLIITWLNVV